jgi:hypothetical protein
MPHGDSLNFIHEYLLDSEFYYTFAVSSVNSALINHVRPDTGRSSLYNMLFNSDGFGHDGQLLSAAA